MKRSSGGLTVAIAIGIALVLGACQSADGEGDERPAGEGAASPQESVTLLVEALNDGDFSTAASLAMPGQPALASLAEGATFGQVADALRTDDRTVPANFWGGFAQGAGDFLTGTVTIDEGEIIERDGIEYHVVRVVTESGDEREIVARDLDGFRIDVFASFAPGLAERMVGPVERLLVAQTDDSRLILSELRGVVPSLIVAVERTDHPSDVVQSVVRLVELITRVG